jgi:hypothetical protein
MKALPSVLCAVGSTLRSHDTKLSRNGATTFQRMCRHEGLSHTLLRGDGTGHVAWVEEVLGTYVARGGMRCRAGTLGMLMETRGR